MFSKFLHLKHWQLFLLAFGIPFVSQFLILAFAYLPHHDVILVVITALLMLFISIVCLGWFYTVTVNLHRRLPVMVRMNLSRFKLSFFFPMIYGMVIVGWLGIGRAGPAMDPDASSHIFPLLLVPVNLFSFYCVIYCMYFVAKALKAVETRQNVSFGDYFGEFLLIWFYPIGIWVIQPRINRIFAEEPETDPDSVFYGM